MKGKYYLSQILTPNRFKGGCLNVVKCPTGAGKTYFIFNELPKYVRCNNYILYITDTKMNIEQIVSSFDNAKEYTKDFREFVNKHTVLVKCGWGDFTQTYITTMSYAKVGAILNYGHPFDWSKFDFVVCDELHNLINYQNIKVKNQSINILDVARAKIEDTINNYPNVKVIGLTATPSKVYKEFKNTYDVLTAQEYDDLRQYETFRIEEYKDYKKVLNVIPQGAKGIIYFTHITDQKEAEQFLNKRGHKTASFWSILNEDHHMTDKQIQVRKDIIKDEMIPNDIDILLINASCETGINIRNIDLYFMVIHSKDIDTITQVRGRLRQDLQLEFIYSPTFLDKPNEVPQGYLNIPLTADQKKLLCNEEIRLLNNKGKPYQWKTVKLYLENNGYKVTETSINRNGKTTRVSIIEKIAIEK